MTNPRRPVFLGLTLPDISLWASSVSIILLAFALFDRTNTLTLAASLLGATSLIFCATGNPLGQLLIIFFGILYSIISFQYAYYGEMCTYLGMTVPMATLSLISWLRHPFEGKRTEVRVGRVTRGALLVILLLTVLVTTVFYFILRATSTPNLLVGTFSVATSFFAVSLTFLRCPYYSLAYALNDVVLIVLWILASFDDRSYVCMVICFTIFLVNDIYGFFNWRRMKKQQEYAEAEAKKEQNNM